MEKQEQSSSEPGKWRTGSVGNKLPIVGLISRWSIAKKFGYSYALAIAISAIGTMAGLAIGEYYENQAMERLAIANEQEHLLDALSKGVMGMRSHPQRLVPALGKTIMFDYERAKFRSYVNHVRVQMDRLENLIDNNYSQLLAAEETKLKELLKKSEDNTSAYVKLVNNLWEQIDPPNVRGEKISAAQQKILVYMSGEIANKIDVKFDRLSENLTYLISTAETQHARARAEQKRASELRLLIIVVSMLLSAAIATFLAFYTSRAIARPLERRKA